MSERLEEIKLDWEQHKEELSRMKNDPDSFYLMRLNDIEQVEWLIEQAELVENMRKLVNYHQQKQKEAEDENEPYRHQNRRYRVAIELSVKTIKHMPRTVGRTQIYNTLIDALEESE